MTRITGIRQEVSADGRVADLRQLARGSSLNLAGSLVAACLNLVLPVIITRNLVRQDAGVFFQATALFMILVTVGTVGADTGMLRSLPRTMAQGRSVEAPRYLPVALVPAVLTSLAIAAVCLALAHPIAALVTGPETTATDAFAGGLRALLPLLPIAVGYAVALAATRGLGSVKPLVFVDKIGRGLAQTAAVWFALLVTTSPTVILLAWAAPYVVAVGAIAWWLTRRIRLSTPRYPGADGAPGDYGALARDFWRFSAPNALSRIFSVALQRVDILIVGALRGPADAAVYTAATRFVILGLMFVQAIQQVMAPRISELLATDDLPRAAGLYRTATTWLTLVSWPIYLLSLAFVPLLLDVFGDGYDKGAAAATVLCLVMLVATVCGPVDSVLLMSGRSTWSLLNTGLALTVNVTLDLLLVPGLGITGAALGWAAAILVNNLLPLFQVQHFLGMHPFGSGTGAAMTVCLASFGVIPTAIRLSLGTTWWSLLLAGTLAAAAFATGAFLCRQPLELGAVSRALHRRRSDPGMGS